MTTARLVASHQIKVQFCSNGVTGMMTARAFGAAVWPEGFWGLSAILSAMGHTWRIFASPERGLSGMEPASGV
jgi:hypothetical protein